MMRVQVPSDAEAAALVGHVDDAGAALPADAITRVQTSLDALRPGAVHQRAGAVGALEVVSETEATGERDRVYTDPPGPHPEHVSFVID